MKKLFTLLMLFVAIVTGANAAGTTAKVIAEGNQYFSAYAEAKTNLSSNNWVTTSGSPGNSSSSYTAPSGWLDGGSGKSGYGMMTVQSGKTVIFTVTNITSVSILGCSNNTSNKTINLSVKEGSTEVGTVATKTTSSNSTPEVLTYGSPLDKTKTYTVTVSASHTDNAKFMQILFVGASAAPVTAYKVSFNAGDHGTYTGDDITETSAGAGITLPNLTTLEDGYKFNGWYSAASGGTKAGDAGATYHPSDDVTVYAQYSVIPTPVFTLSKTDLEVGETANILVDGENIFADNFTAGTLWESAVGGPFIELSADGVVTAVKNTPEGYYFTFYGNSKDLTKYKSASSGSLPLTISTKYAITPLVGIEHGSVSADKATAAEGETVTLTATPASKYVLSAWNVYKTGEPETTVTVTDNKFTMPAYAVTVAATFVADTRKQVLYVTSDGNVNSSDDLYAALSEDYGVTVAAYDASISPLTVTSFDLVVLHESINGDYANTGLVADAKGGNVPVLNTKSYFYTKTSKRWSWGTPNAGQTVNGCSLNTFYTNIASHPIFEGVTVTNGFVQVVGTAAAKAMQPVESFETGYEGYTLATSPLKESENTGTAIHELTPAQRGVTSAKYLLISVSNACLNDLTANGKKLFQNAAAYLMSNEAWTPSVTTTVTLGANGYSTFAGEHNFTVSGATAYTAAASSSKVTLTECAANAVIAAGKGIVLKGTEGAKVTITYSTDEATVTSTGLEGVISSTTTISENPYVLASNGTKTAFIKAGSTYGTVSALMNKAYLNGTALSLNSLDIDFGGATAINNVNANDNANSAAPVKVIKNGQLYIGNYNVAGQLVK